MRVLHVSTGREWRGGQAQLLHLLRADPEARVILPSGAPLAQRAPGQAIPSPLRGAWWGTAALVAEARRRRPDLIAAHDANALAHALRVPGVPVVAHRRVDFRPSIGGAARCRSSAGVVAVSEAVARVLARVGVRRVRVVWDGVPFGPVEPAPHVRRSLGLAEDRPLVVAVGALVPHKDHATLLDAASTLPRVQVAILGEGPLRRSLQARAARLGMAARLRLPGQVEEVGPWLAAADVVVHPSREEGLGQAAVEAVAAGACVITSDGGGLLEIPGVAHRFPAGDPSALAAALILALRDPRAGRRLALAAAPLLRSRFSVASMVDGTRQAWDAFLGDAGGSVR